ncbi:breast carcinoma-amplified sequence 1 isoform 1-T1 [Polymixia lowei]
MFKKKTESPKSERCVQEKESSTEDQMDAGPTANDPQSEPAEIKQDSETFEEPKSVPLDPSPEEGEPHDTDKDSNQLVESQEESKTEENPVMNFFKTLVTPTKTPKKETAIPDATKDQSQKEIQPTATTTTVAQITEPPAAPKGMSMPPPPPPEPPKMEIKGEPAAKPVKPTPKEEPKAAAKEPEASKGKSTKDTLSKFFRAKKVDASKTSTLEAAAKPEPPPPVQEEKKMPSKSSFLSFFKPKVLLNQMATKVQAASTSGVRLLRKTTGVAADPKKDTPAPPAATEVAQTMKAKDEPKAAMSPEAPVDNKSASGAFQGGDESANIPRKLEKRNSIHLFFKNLGQKRHSTDAGVQTEPVTVAPAPEKAK